ncbi:MAG: glycosyltransferase family 39 protein [Clostridiales bacterium]|nr:glycosyltransferase family 39 protein [Clostridiales bacterium]
MLFFVFVLGFTLVGVIAFHNITPEATWGHINAIDDEWLNVFMRWDGLHYSNIAAQGYGEFNSFNYAFFPLYPILINLLNRLTNVGYFQSAIYISRVAFFIFIIILYNTVKKRHDSKRALYTVISASLFPGAFFYIAPYTESLFVLLALVTFLSCEKERWLCASICVMFACSLKFLGVILIPIVIIEYLHKYRRIYPNFLFFLLMPLGLGGYMYFLYQETGNALYFSFCETAYSRFKALPPLPLIKSVKNLITAIKSQAYTAASDFILFKNYLMETVFSITNIICIIFSYKKIERKYFLYCILAFIIPFSTFVGAEGLSGMIRYSLALFPLFFMFGEWFETRWFRWTYSLLGISLNIFLMSLYAAWYWVA